MHAQTIALRSSTAIRDKVMWPALKNAFGMLGRLRDEGAMLSCIENVSVSRFRQGGLFTQERTSFIFFVRRCWMLMLQGTTRSFGPDAGMLFFEQKSRLVQPLYCGHAFFYESDGCVSIWTRRNGVRACSDLACTAPA